MSTQLRALKDYAKSDGYSVAREYVDEAESGRFADRPQFREIIEEGSKPNSLSCISSATRVSVLDHKGARNLHMAAFKEAL